MSPPTTSPWDTAGTRQLLSVAPAAADNLDARRAAAAASETGRAVLEALATQGEQLNRTEERAEHASFAVGRSNRVLRGMGSWGGWFANVVTPDAPAVPPPTPPRTSSAAPAAGRAPPPAKISDPVHGRVVPGDDVDPLGLSSGPHAALYREQDAHLAAMSAATRELSGIGVTIGSALTSQVEATGRIAAATEMLEDDVRMVNRRAGRILQGKWFKGEKRRFLMYATVRQNETQLMLGSMNDVVVLSASSPHATANVWALWARQGNALGLRNELTGRWLGQGFLGDIQCRASEFGRREEWEIDEQKMSHTRLICSNANWGTGGWIHANADTLVAKGNDSGSKDGAALWSFTEAKEYTARKDAKAKDKK